MDIDKLDAIILKITKNIHTEADISTLRQILSEYKNEGLTQLGKYNVNISTGKDIHIGDRIYQQWDDDAIQALVKTIREADWRFVERPRSEKLLLQQVKEEVVARLKLSLHNAVMINLGKEAQPEQVKRPWSSDIKIGDKPSEPIPDEKSVLEVFDQEEIGGKLLILGAPGAGKTTTMLDLAKSLINRAEQDIDYPISVLFNLSMWKDDKQSIRDWLVMELNSKYGVRKDIGRKWVSDAKLLPMLDGLDELKSMRQELCARKINEFLQSDNRPQYLIVCSRIEEYEKIVRRQWQQDVQQEAEEISTKQEIRLHLNGAIFLKPLTEQQIQAYLLGLNQAELWQTLQLDVKLLNFVKTPLFLSILGFSSFHETLSLQKWKTLTSSEAHREYLFDVYCETVIERSLSTREMDLKGLKSFSYQKKNPPSTRQTRKYLVYLAQQLQRECQTEFLIEKMQPNWLLTRFQHLKYHIGVGIITTCPFTVAAMETSFQDATVSTKIGKFLFMEFFLALYCAFASRAWLNQIRIIERLKWSWARFTETVLGVIIFLIFMPLFVIPFWSLLQRFVINVDTWIIYFLGLIIGFAFKNIYSRITNSKIALSFCLNLGALIGVITSLFWFVYQEIDIIPYLTGEIIQGIREITDNKESMFIMAILAGIIRGIIPPNIYKPTYPNQGIYRSALNAVIFALTVLLILLILVVFLDLISLRTFSLNKSIYFLLVFFGMFGYPLSLIPGFACLQHFTLRLILYRNGYIPWNYARFLDYCTERLFLQRVGGRYRFIHRLLQEHFAKMPLEIQRPISR